MYSQFMRILYHFILYVFLSRVSVLIWDSCMSVCLSVCLSRCDVVSKQIHIASDFFIAW